MIFRIKADHPAEDSQENRTRIIHPPPKADRGIVPETGVNRLPVRAIFLSGDSEAQNQFS